LLGCGGWSAALTDLHKDVRWRNGAIEVLRLSAEENH
jgi:hypothetical protein